METNAEIRMSPLRRIGGFGIAQLVVLVTGLALQTLTARWLSTPDYARFVLFHTVSCASVLLLMSGIPNGLRRLLSASPGMLPAAWRSILCVQFPLTAVFAAAFVALAQWSSATLDDPQLATVIPLVAGEILLRAGLVEPCWGLLNGLGYHRLQALLIAAHSLLRCLGAICLLWLSPVLANAAMGLTTSAIVSLAFVVLVMRRLRREPVAQTSLVPPGLMVRWLALSPVAEALGYLLVAGNLWMLRAGVGDSQIGTYAACYMLAQVLLPLGLVLSRGSFARFAFLVSQDRRREAADLLLQIMRLATPPVILGVTVTLVYGDAVVEFIFGEAYSHTGPLLGLLCAGVSAVAAQAFFSEMLFAADRLKTRLAVLVGVGVASIGMTASLIQTAGTLGAAWALVGTGAAGIFATAVPLRSIVGQFMPWKTVIRAVGVATALIVAAHISQRFIEPFPPIVGLVTLALAYMAALLLLGEWRWGTRGLRIPCEPAASPERSL